MKASAIRKMGGVAAKGRDIVSFAPGFPAPELCSLAGLSGNRAPSSSRAATVSVLQYGPTRGYPPLLDAIAGVMARRGAPTAATA